MLTSDLRNSTKQLSQDHIGLIKVVCHQLTEHKDSWDQSVWVQLSFQARDEVGEIILNERDSTNDLEDKHVAAGEAVLNSCGTSGCVAGWAVLLGTPLVELGEQITGILDSCQVSDDYHHSCLEAPYDGRFIALRAQQLLGLSDSQAQYLFGTDIEEDQVIAYLENAIADEKWTALSLDVDEEFYGLYGYPDTFVDLEDKRV